MIESLLALVSLAWPASAAITPPPAELNKNLLANGDVATLDDGHPVGWEYWDPKYTRVIQMPGRQGNVVEIDMDEYVAAFDGVQVYSAYIPIQEGVRYRFSVDLMTDGASLILWVKGYGPSVYRGRTLPMDELYREQHQIHDLALGQWKRETVHFLVKPPEEYVGIPFKSVTHARVMVYAFWPAKKCYFANARFEAVEIWEPPPKAIVDPGTVKPKEGEAQPKTEEEMALEAKNLFWEEKWKPALEFIDKLVSINPKSALYRFMRFRLCYQVDRLNDSLAEMDRLEKMLAEPDAYMKSWIALYRARIAFRRRDPAAARKLYARAIELASDDAAVDQAKDGLAGLEKTEK